MVPELVANYYYDWRKTTLVKQKLVNNKRLSAHFEIDQQN